jgi:ABC-2 type transport system permease protein
MAALTTMLAMIAMRMSPHYEAAELFHRAPLASTAPLFHGARKAVLAFFVLPAVAAAGAILWFAQSDHATLRFAVPGLIMLPTMTLVGGLRGDWLPFELPLVVGEQAATVAGGAMGWGFLSFMGVIAVMALSLVAVNIGRWLGFMPVVGVLVVLLIVTHVFMLRTIRMRSVSRREGA